MIRPALAAAALVVALLPACAKKPAAPAGGADAAPAKPAAADAAPAKPAARPEAPPPSKEARATYRKQLAAGRKLAKASKWGEAATAFDAALTAIPGDGRALSELSWAAFNAGDYARAKAAGGRAVLGSTDKKVKASALYNLGRVEEALKNVDAAARLYRESIELRPSKAVEERLAGLGKPAAPADPSDANGLTHQRFCHEPMALDKICTCIEGLASYWDEFSEPGERSCTLEKTAVPGLHLAHATLSLGEEMHILVAEGPGGAAVVTVLERTYNPGAFGVSEDWSLEGMKTEAAGARQLVYIRTSHDRRDSDLGINEVEAEHTETLTLCVLGDAKSATTCPLQVPTKHTYVREALLDAAEAAEAGVDLEDLGTKGLPIKSELEVDVKVDIATGVAQVVLAKGAAGDWVRAKLGDKKLW